MKKVAFALTALTLAAGSAVAGNMPNVLGSHDDAPVHFNASLTEMQAGHVVSPKERAKLGLAHDDVVTLSNFAGHVVDSGFEGER